MNDAGEYICGHEIEKMSKSKYNVQSPDELVDKFGADTLRLYEMFLGPLEQSKPWDTQGITGVYNFLRKFWRLVHDENNNFLVSNGPPTDLNYKTLHKTIKKVEEDIERHSFNTVVSTFMICVNEFVDQKCNNKEIISSFTILLSPYAPHIAEEIWSKLGNKTFISQSTFPEWDHKFLVEDEVVYPIAFNGKMRFKITLSSDLTREQIHEHVLKHEKTAHYLEGRSYKKIIIIPNKIVNIVL